MDEEDRNVINLYEESKLTYCSSLLSGKIAAASSSHREQALYDWNWLQQFTPRVPVAICDGHMVLVGKANYSGAFLHEFSRPIENLGVAAAECQKAANVDITLILAHCNKCAEQIDRLHINDTEPTRQAALKELKSTLSYHQMLLTAKIKQLDDIIINSPAVNVYNSVQADTRAPSDKEEMSSHKRSRRRAIQETIVEHKQYTFDDVAGLHEAKQSLKEAIILPVQYPHLFTGARKPWKRILLYGPPGTGKSRLARAVAAEIKSAFYCVSSSDLISSWVGESEKLIKELFQHATNQEGRSVIFIDEVDSVCRRRSSREEEHTRRIKTELLQQMEGATSPSAEQVFLLAATNCPWELDTAFLRRFQKRIYIPLPDKLARLSLMRIHTRENPAPLTDTEWNTLAECTEGYSGSDLAALMLGALFEPIRELQKATHWRHTQEDKLVPCQPNDSGAIKADISDLPAHKVTPREVHLQDFMTSLHQHHHTITAEDLCRFSDFTENFGLNG